MSVDTATSDDGDGDGGQRMGRLARRLYESGCRFMRVALAAHSNGDHELFAMHAAIAVEHLTKARLAAVNPMLLLDFKGQAPSADVLLWVADDTRHDEPVPAGLRTIGGDRALELLRKQVPLDRFSEALKRLRGQRNGLSHMGEADLTDLADDLPMVVGAAAALAEGLIGSYPSTELFGVHTGFAETQLAQWNHDEDREYFGRFEQAQQRLLEKYPDVATNRELRAMLAGAVERQFVAKRSSFDEQLAPCPVCTLPAFLYGRLEPDFDKDGSLLNAYPTGVYHPSRLDCPTCNLVLDSASLIDRSHLMENWHVPHHDLMHATVDMAATANQYFPDHS